MIKMSNCAALAVALGVSFAAQSGFAQIRDDLAQPAEIPPDSYSGRQYVDSRGCIYIRAGIDGNVTWVPRVDRNRQVICSSSGAGGGGRVAEAPAPKPVPVPAPAPAPVRTEPPKPAPAPVVAAPAPEPTPAPAPRAVVRKAEPRVVTPKPRSVRKATPAPVRRVVRSAQKPAPVIVIEEPAAAPVPAPRRATRKIVVGQYTDLPPNTVLRSKNGTRKGPVLVVNSEGRVVKTTDDGVRVYAGDSGRTHVTGKTVVAPKRAYERGASVDVPVPNGYEPAFKDGRHSRTRAHQTLDGRRKMLLIWSNTVPRKLIDQYTGEEVGRYFPELKYPYRSMKEQRAAMTSTRSEAPRAAPKKLRRVAKPSTPASHRFVKLGSFSSRAKAEGAIHRLRGAGLPVSVNEYTSGGTHYFMVLAGPFQSQERLLSALDMVRHRIGYRSASLRQ